MDVEEEAARAEIARLIDEGAGLAVEIMKAWQADPGKPRTRQEIAAWLLRDFSASQRLLPLLRSAVRRGCELLTEEGLLEERRPTGYVVGPDGAADSGQAGLAPTLRGERLLTDRDLDRWLAKYMHRHLDRMAGSSSDYAPGAWDGDDMPPGDLDVTELLADAEFEQRRSGGSTG